MKRVYLDPQGKELLVIESSMFPPIELEHIGQNIVFQGHYRKLMNCSLKMGILSLTVGEKGEKIKE